MEGKRSRFSGMSDRDLVERARDVLSAAVLEAAGSPERATAMAAHDAIVHELKLRLFEHVNAKFGLPDTLISAAALEQVELDL